MNCAGILKDARIEKMEPAVFRQVLDVNLIGMLTTTAAALPALRSSETGRIISLTSRAWLGNFGSTNYAASKGGIAGVSRSLSLALAADGITVNCIAPGSSKHRCRIRCPTRSSSGCVNPSRSVEWGSPSMSHARLRSSPTPTPVT